LNPSPCALFDIPSARLSAECQGTARRYQAGCEILNKKPNSEGDSFLLGTNAPLEPFYTQMSMSV
jgi:hypothetical protein